MVITRQFTKAASSIQVHKGRDHFYLKHQIKIITVTMVMTMKVLLLLLLLSLLPLLPLLLLPLLLLLLLLGYRLAQMSGDNRETTFFFSANLRLSSASKQLPPANHNYGRLVIPESTPP